MDEDCQTLVSAEFGLDKRDEHKKNSYYRTFIIVTNSVILSILLANYLPRDLINFKSEKDCPDLESKKMRIDEMLTNFGGEVISLKEQDLNPEVNTDFISAEYWEGRYSMGGNSGKGSYSENARFKAVFLNNFVEKNKIQTVTEMGVGDGNQLTLSNYPQYLGMDISKTTIENCRKRFKEHDDKHFQHIDRYMTMTENSIRLSDIKVDLAMSLDVLYHLIENEIYRLYLDRLFSFSQNFVIIFSSNMNRKTNAHVLHRRFTDDVEKWFPRWSLVQQVNNTNPRETANFFVYKRKLWQ